MIIKSSVVHFHNSAMTESNSSITQSIGEECNVPDYVPKNEICQEARTMIAKWEAMMTLAQGNQRPPNYLNYMAMSHTADMSSPPTRYRRKASNKSVDTNWLNKIEPFRFVVDFFHEWITQPCLHISFDNSQTLTYNNKQIYSYVSLQDSLGEPFAIL